MKNSLQNFPEIDFKFWLKQYNWTDSSSIRGMITQMQNAGYIDADINYINIEEKIEEVILNYYKSENIDILKKVFNNIQTWGGLSTRIYTPRIIANWENGNNVKYYNFVSKILNDKPLDAYNNLTNRETRISGLGFSFVPKHICFWTGLGKRANGYPILDNVIAKLVYNKKESKNVDYGFFIKDFEMYSQQNGSLKSSEIEMALFSFSNYYWETAKTGTLNFKFLDDNILIKKDGLAAMKIAERNLGC